MYLQIKQTAERLGCSRQWVHTLINRGSLNTAHIVGRRVVVEDDQFKALEKARKREG